MERADVEEMIDQCESAAHVPKCNGGPGFSQWEHEFIESLREQFDAGRSLSERQLEKLAELAEKT